MAESVGQLTVALIAETSDFKKQMKDAKEKVSEFRKSMGETGEQLVKLGGTMTKYVTAPIVAAVTGITMLAKSTGNYADQLLDLEHVTGMSTDALQEMEHIARVAGVSFEGLMTGARYLTRYLPAIARGEGEAADAMQQLEVDIHDAEGAMRSMGDIFPEVLAALGKMDNDTERNALAMVLLGRNVAAIAPVLGLSADKIEEARKEAHDLGMVLDRDALEGANDFRIAMDTMQAQMGSLVHTIGAELGPVLTEVLIPAIREHVIPAIEWLVEKVVDVIHWFGELDPSIQEAILAATAFAAIMGPAIGAVGFVLMALAGPMGIIALVIAAVGALGAAWIMWGDDIKAAVDGAVNFVIDKYERLLDWIDRVKEALGIESVDKETIQAAVDVMHETGRTGAALRLRPQIDEMEWYRQLEELVGRSTTELARMVQTGAIDQQMFQAVLAAKEIGMEGAALFAEGLREGLEQEEIRAEIEAALDIQIRTQLLEALEAFFKKEGIGLQRGGLLGGYGGGDRIPALLEAGEAVVPKEAVSGGIGAVASWFKAMGAPGFQTGGIAGVPLVVNPLDYLRFWMEEKEEHGLLTGLLTAYTRYLEKYAFPAYEGKTWWHGGLGMDETWYFLMRLMTAEVDANSLLKKLFPNTSRLLGRIGGGGEPLYDILTYSTGAILPGYGGGDRIPALLEAGEAIVPKEAVSGGISTVASWFQAMGAPGFQDGVIYGLPLPEHLPPVGEWPEVPLVNPFMSNLIPIESPGALGMIIGSLKELGLLDTEIEIFQFDPFNENVGGLHYSNFIMDELAYLIRSRQTGREGPREGLYEWLAGLGGTIPEKHTDFKRAFPETFDWRKRAEADRERWGPKIDRFEDWEDYHFHRWIYDQEIELFWDPDLFRKLTGYSDEDLMDRYDEGKMGIRNLSVPLDALLSAYIWPSDASQVTTAILSGLYLKGIDSMEKLQFGDPETLHGIGSLFSFDDVIESILEHPAGEALTAVEDFRAQRLSGIKEYLTQSPIDNIEQFVAGMFDMYMPHEVLLAGAAGDLAKRMDAGEAWDTLAKDSNELIVYLMAAARHALFPRPEDIIKPLRPGVGGQYDILEHQVYYPTPTPAPRVVAHERMHWWQGEWLGADLMSVMYQWESAYLRHVKQIKDPNQLYRSYWVEREAWALHEFLENLLLQVPYLEGQLREICEFLYEELFAAYQREHLAPPKEFSTGGILPGYGGGDRIPALLEAGEAVVPASAVRGGLGAITDWFMRMGVPGFQHGRYAGDGGASAGGFNWREFVEGISWATDAVKDFSNRILQQIPFVSAATNNFNTRMATQSDEFRDTLRKTGSSLQGISAAAGAGVDPLLMIGIAALSLLEAILPLEEFGRGISDVIGPAMNEVGHALRMVGETVGVFLLPLFELFAEGVRWAADGAVWLAIKFLETQQGLTLTLLAIYTFLDGLSILGISLFDFSEEIGALIDYLVDLEKAMDDLHDIQERLRKGYEESEKTLRTWNEQMRNVPRTFKFALERWRATMHSGGAGIDPRLPSPGFPGPSPGPGLPPEPGRPVVNITITGDNYGLDELERKLEQALDRIMGRASQVQHGTTGGGW